MTTKTAVDPMPSGLDVDTTTNLIFVDGQQNGTVTIINGLTGEIIVNALPLAGSSSGSLAPHGVAVDSTTHTAYVANQGNNTVSVVSETNGTWSVANTVNLPPNSQPHGVGVNPVAKFVYVANQGNNNMSVIDVSVDPPVEIPGSPFATGSNPHGIGVDSVNNLVLVANRKSGSVSIFQGAVKSGSSITAPSLLATPTVGSTSNPQPTGIGVNPTLQLAYVSNNNENSVSVLNYASPSSPRNPAVSTIENVGSGPDRFALNTDTNDIYVSDNTASQVTSIASSSSIQGTVTVGSVDPASNPTEMGYLPATGLLYVALQADNEVVGVDPSSFNA